MTITGLKATPIVIIDKLKLAQRRKNIKYVTEPMNLNIKIICFSNTFSSMMFFFSFKVPSIYFRTIFTTMKIDNII